MKGGSAVNALKKLKSLSLPLKIQIIIALALTAALIISIPTYSWFNYEKKIAELAKIKSPDNLYINAAHKEDIVYLDMSSIDVSQKDPDSQSPITSQSFVFSVSGEWVTNFTLQIEHTKNNPFTYSFHEGIIYATKDAMSADHSDWQERNSDGSLKYVEYTATNIYDAKESAKISDWPAYPENDVASIEDGSTYYIWIGGDIKNKNNETGSYLSPTPALREKSYESGTNYDTRVVPSYWQLNKILTGSDKNVPFYKTYVITASWTDVENIENYKKETDLFYISAFVGG